MLTGFPPVLRADSVAIVLGSFPSVASLEAGHYYAHPRNAFWPIVADALDLPGLAGLDFNDRYARVLDARLGVWDVIGACQRKGSLDTAIRAAQPNAITSLRRLAPALRWVLFNGKTAARSEPDFVSAGYRTIVLPSTSPAHAGMTFDEKRRRWRLALRAALGADEGGQA
ncbi:MAG: DNA-deoxyinosine glycosylase [Burkholderiaceae bacterium]|nr:DNA-deoxyinosine glycosylase [Burkholderiaceae bacterium]